MFICFDYAQKVKEMCPEKRLNRNLQKMFALKQTCIFIAFFKLATYFSEISAILRKTCNS